MAKSKKDAIADDVVLTGTLTETPVIEPIEETNNAAKNAFKSLKAKLLAMKNQPGSSFSFDEEIAVLEQVLK